MCDTKICFIKTLDAKGSCHVTFLIRCLKDRLNWLYFDRKLGNLALALPDVNAERVFIYLKYRYNFYEQ